MTVNPTRLHRDRLPFYAPRRHQNKIFTFLRGNLAGDPDTPPVQAWYSGPGEGKTFTIQGTCLMLKCEVALFDPVYFESPDAGVPVIKLKECIEQARNCIRGKKNDPMAAAVLINDVDLGTGDLGCHVQTTSNRVGLNHYLMDYADRCCSRKNRKYPRVPILMTMNRPESMYPPLVRSGRAQVLPWALTPCEKCQTVMRIYPQLSERECKRLVAAFAGESIAFFASLRRTIQMRQPLDDLDLAAMQQQLHEALLGTWEYPPFEPTIEQLLEVGHQIEHERQGLLTEVIEEPT